jgi:hypothetical protein
VSIKNTLIDDTLQPIGPTASEVSNKDFAITVMFFCNLNSRDPLDITAGREFIDVYVASAGGAPASENKIINQLPLDAGDTFTFNTERLILNADDIIYASTTTLGSVSATVSYIKI